MSLYVPIEDLRLAINTAELGSTAVGVNQQSIDNDLKTFCKSAGKFADKYCKRAFNAAKLTTEYFSGNEVSNTLVLRAYPLLSITSLNDDPYLNFDASSLLSAADYVLLAERGELMKRVGKFQCAQNNIKVVYKGGYIPETTVVTGALAANTMTVLNNLLSYAQEFSVFIQTSGAQSAGNITLVGTDPDGNSLTETIAFTGTNPQRKISSFTWGSITSFSALPVQGAGATGTIKVTATSIPANLRQAIALLVSHNYFQKLEQNINVTSRSEDTESESGIVKDMPKEVFELLDGFRDYL